MMEKYSQAHCKRKTCQRLVIIAMFALVLPVVARATSGITYQGRILRPDGSPLSGANTQFKLQIRTPDSGSCLMYEEVQSLDLRNSAGAFSLTINDGTGSRLDTSGLSLDRIFANRGSFSLDPSTCSVGSGAYSPGPADGRNLVVLFKDENMSSWEPVPAQKINYVPYAFESKQVGGFTSDSIMRVVNASGDPMLGISPLSNAQYVELMALISGTTSQYAKTNQLGGSALPTMNSGEVLGWNGSAWVSTTSAPGAASITNAMIQNNVIDGSKLSPSIAITTSGTIASAITTTRDFKIFSASPSTYYVGFLADPSLAASYNLTWPLTKGTNGQVLTSDGAGKMTWSTPSSAGMTSLTGDVSATGPGAAAATVIAVGGSLAAQVHSAEILANAATASNTSSTLVRRDSSGGFLAGAVSGSSVLLRDSTTGTIGLQAPPSVTPYTLTLPSAAAASNGQVLTSNTSGVLSWTTMSGAPTGSASGDLSGSYPGPTVATVGTSTASNIHAAELLANAATSANTNNAIVKRNGTGDFSANVATVNGLALNNSGAVLNLVNPVGGAWTMTLPVSAGSSGQILSTNGSGTTAWINQSVSPWTIQAPGINYTGGRVGIGTTSPGYALVVTDGTANPSVAVGPSTGASTSSALIVMNSKNAGVDKYSEIKTDFNGSFYLKSANTFYNFQSGSGLNVLSFGSNGQINHTDLTAMAKDVGGGANYAGYYNGSSTSTFAALRGQKENATSGDRSGYMQFSTSTAGGGLLERLRIDSNGNVGIGTTAPNAKFDVKGPIVMTGAASGYAGFQPAAVAGSTVWTLPSADGTSGQVLTTNGSGVLSWAAAGGSSQWTTQAPGINYTGGNVGIGTTSPNTKLEIAGSVRVGDGGENCSAAIAGAIRYNGGNLQFCTGTPPWTTLGVAGSGISSLTGDVTATGPGAAAATVASVGGSSAAQVHSAELLANAASNLNTASAIVKRDASGNFAASAVTSTSSIFKDSGSNTATIQAPSTVSSSYILKLPTAAASSSQLLQSDSSGNMSWVSMPTSLPPSGAAGGDLSGVYPSPTVATVGTSTAANVHSAELLANAATAASTNNAIIKRDGVGNFAANVATVNGVALNNAGAVVNVVNPVGSGYTLTLPTGTGTAGQVLATDGTGVTSWATALTSSNGFTNGGNSFAANASVGVNDAYALNFKTSNAIRATITADGRVGIGTTSPVNQLEVRRGGGFANGSIGFSDPALAHGMTDDTRTDTSMFISSAGSSSGGGLFWAYSGSSTAPGLEFNAVANAPLATTSAFLFNAYKKSGTTIGALAATDTALRITNGSNQILTAKGSGSIGIGTTAPNAKLDVKGAIVMSGATSGYTGFQPAAAAGSTIWTLPASDGTSGQVMSTNGSGVLSWATPSSGGISALTGDVTASGSGSVAATVANVGGATAASIASTVTTVNAATTANVPSTLVKRNATGAVSVENFKAAAVTAQSLYLTSGTDGPTLTPGGSSNTYTLMLPDSLPSVSGQLLSATTSGVMSWVTPSTSPTGAAGGDLSGTYPNPSVAQVGGYSAANVAAGATLANAATSASTSNALLKRDGVGNFSGNVATMNGLALNNGGSLLNIVNPVGGAWTMTLPANAGSNGQVLSTNGSGVLSWAAAGGASQWTTQAPGINYLGGNVGIGTTSPTAKLEVSSSGSGSVQTLVMRANPGGTGSSNLNSMVFDSVYPGNFKNEMSFRGSGVQKWAMGNDVFGTGGQNFYIYNGSTNSSAIFIDGSDRVGISMGTASPTLANALDVKGSAAFGTYAGSAAPSNGMIVSGNVGIGTTSPTAKLHVNGTNGSNNDPLASFSTTGVNDSNSLSLGNGSGTINLFVSGQSNGFIAGSVAGDSGFRGGAGGILFGTASTMAMKIANGGNVGIGTTSPDALLTVAGQMYSQMRSPASASTVAIDFGTGNVQRIVLTGATTFTVSNAKAGAVYTLLVVQDASGSRAVTWPASAKWPGGVAPVLSATPNAVDVFTFVSDGSSLLNIGYASDVK